VSRFETISIDGIRLGAGSETALWSMSFALVTATMAAALYAAAFMVPPSQDMGGGAPVIMIDFAPLPVSPVSGEDQFEAESAEAMQASDDEALAGSDEPASSADAEPEPEAPAPQDDAPVAEAVDSAEIEGPVTEAEPLEQPQAIDDDVAPEPLAVEPEIALPWPTAIPDDIAQLRAQTPATSHAPPPQQAAQRSAAPAQTTANQAASRPAAPSATQAPPAPQISPQRWQGQLFAHLERFKRYPSAASQRREQGTVYVQFSIDNAGNILSSRIVRSSGYANLDEAVSQMMRTASPVPRPPAELGNPVTLTAPIEFALR
jgi:protein TonB